MEPNEYLGDSFEELAQARKAAIEAIHGYWRTQIYYVVAELGVPDLIQKHGPQTAEELASKLKCDSSRLFRILRAFQSFNNGFSIDEHNRFGLTAVSKVLLTDHPMSVRNMARLNGSTERFGSWMHLLNMVNGGDVAWKQQNTLDFYSFMACNPEHAEVFNSCMTDYSGTENDALAGSYDFSSFGTVADVGGGQGSLLLSILAKTPGAKGMLVDQPEVQQKNETNISLVNIAKIGVDIFAPGGIPAGADVYILKNVVHDHSVEKNVLLLKNIHKALQASSNPNKCVLIMEHIVSTDYSKPGDYAKILDIHFMVLCDSQERTLAEYCELFSQAGFEFSRVINSPTRTGRRILEAKPKY